MKTYPALNGLPTVLLSAATAAAGGRGKLFFTAGSGAPQSAPAQSAATTVLTCLNIIQSPLRKRSRIAVAQNPRNPPVQIRG